MGANVEMAEAERALLEHRHAVRVNLPVDVDHAARTLARAVGVASYARLEAPGEVLEAVAAVTAWAGSVRAQVEAETAERERTGAGQAEFQHSLEHPRGPGRAVARPRKNVPARPSPKARGAVQRSGYPRDTRPGSWRPFGLSPRLFLWGGARGSRDMPERSTGPIGRGALRWKDASR